jgi:hypothetical protein
MSNAMPAADGPLAAGEPPWNRLGRPTLGVGSAPPFAAVLAGLTFGVGPAVLWPWRWATLLDRDRPYYRELASWWQARVSPKEAAQLNDVIGRLRPRPILMILPWLAAAFTVASAVVFLSVQRPDLHGLIPRLASGTYRLRHAGLRWGHDVQDHLHFVWIWTLAFAYGCHLYAVRTHALAVGDLVRWTNKVSREHEVRRVRNETGRLGLGPVWVGTAVVLCVYGAWWVIPMVLAGAAQRRYADVASPRLQQALAAQAGDAVALTGTTAAARFCPTPNCTHRLPAPAAYCPRCGAATVANLPTPAAGRRA